MAWIIFKVLILTSMLCSVYSTKCPDSDLISPCTCYEKNDPRRVGRDMRYFYPYMSLFRNDSIVIGCRGNIFLSKVFEEIDEKYQGIKQFDNFYLSSYPMETIEENILRNTTFKETIIIADNDLETIHQDAFTETGKVTKELIITRNKKLGNSLFETIKKFTAAKSIKIISNNITEIPSGAFTTQSNLSSLFISDSIKIIGSKAFTCLINLKHLLITGNKLDSIPEFAFEISEPSKYPVYIDLDLYKLNNSTFAPNAFSNIRRPTMLTLAARYVSLKYLDENVFLPFLQDNPLNTIFLNMFSFDYNESHNPWIKNNGMEKRVYINGISLYKLVHWQYGKSN